MVYCEYCICFPCLYCSHLCEYLYKYMCCDTNSKITPTESITNLKN